MLVNSTGIYITESGAVAYVTETDGYRRCHGYLKEDPRLDMSWYTETGSVRHGMATGNALACKLDGTLPDGAKERGEDAQRSARKEHMDRICSLQAAIEEGGGAALQAVSYWKHKHDSLQSDNDALRARVAELATTLIESGCHLCGGDCSAANPPVTQCPIAFAEQYKKEAEQ